MKPIKIFFRRFIKDLRNKELMTIKLIFFLKTATMFVLYPYLTIHMRQLGISVEETALMGAITPFVTIVMPPVAGLIADRIGNFKLMLSLLSAMGGATALLLLLVPISRSNMLYPDSLVLATASCGSDANFIYGLYQNYPCDLVSDARTELTLQSCGYSCTLGTLNNRYVKDILASRNYKLNIHNAKLQSDTTYQYKITESEKPKIVHDLRETRKLENYEIAVRQLSSDALFFPAQKPRLFGIECNTGRNSTVCAFESANGERIKVKKLKTSLREIKPTDIDKAEERHRFLAEGIQCALSSDEEIETAGVEVQLADNVVKLDECRRSCVFTAPRKQVCRNMKVVVEYNPTLTFWLYMILRVSMGVISATTFPMFEGATIAILRKQKGDYGLQKIYGSIGSMISSPLSGMLIDYASRDKEYSDLRPAFYLYAALRLVTSFFILMMNLEFKVPTSNVTSAVMTVLKNIEVVALLIACFVLGMAWGYIESFLFWLLEDIGASKSLMGITITVGAIAGIPLLALSGSIINKIGHANVIFLGLLFYSIRTLGYSLIYNPWLSLIFDALDSITSQLASTAAATYSAKLSTTSTDSSIQGLLGGIYYGFGKGSGNLVGGLLMKAVGTRTTFQIFSAVTLIIGLAYMCFIVFYISKRPQAKDIDIVENKYKKTEENDNVTTSIEEGKIKKEKEIEGDPYINDNIEAVNNVKNADVVNSIPEVSASNDDVEVNQINSGVVNVGFEADDEVRKEIK